MVDTSTKDARIATLNAEVEKLRADWATLYASQTSHLQRIAELVELLRFWMPASEFARKGLEK
jgi:hypothetical protein